MGNVASTRSRPVGVLGGPLAAVGPPVAVHRHLEVLGHRQGREHALPAGHHGDAEPGDLVGRRAGDVAPVEDDRAVGRRHDAGDGLEQGRLAGAVGAEQGHDLALAHLEVDAEEHLDVAVAHVELRARAAA